MSHEELASMFKECASCGCNMCTEEENAVSYCGEDYCTQECLDLLLEDEKDMDDTRAYLSRTSNFI